MSERSLNPALANFHTHLQGEGIEKFKWFFNFSFLYAFPLGRSQNNFNGFIGNRMLLGFNLLEIMNFQITWPRSMKLPTRPLFTIILAILP